MSLLPSAPDVAEAAIAAADWCGRPVDCGHCDAGGAAGLRCERGRACVHDRYARRIDRYFNWNPQTADRWLTHPYFEVRAIAVRHASVFRLPEMMADPDETVRLSVAMRLPQRQLRKLMNDPHREVRIRVAGRLDPDALTKMCDDDDYYVRLQVARRLPLALLARMAADPDPQVRRTVALRLDPAALGRMAQDGEVGVRRIVAARALPPLQQALAADPAWEVRREVALHAGRALAAALSADPEPEVVAAAEQRLAALDASVGTEASSHD